MDPDELLLVLAAATDAVRSSVGTLTDWGPTGAREGQYRSDLAADEAACSVLLAAGLGVLSEESGEHESDRTLLAVVDPLDGSTNASRGLPWFATSICVLDATGPLVALVVNQSSGVRYEAVRGRGARRDGRPIVTGSTAQLARSVVALSGHPGRDLGWAQFRAFGAAALDLCAVADGSLDAFVDCILVPHGGVWDYLGGLLVCREAGALVVDRFERELVVRDWSAWRSPIAAATPALLGELIDGLAATS